MLKDNLLFEVSGGDFIQRAGGDPGGGQAQFFRLGQDLFVVQAELLCNVVNPNGHISVLLRPLRAKQPS
jgi:hypothetical protein